MRYIDLHQDIFWYTQNPNYIKGELQTSWQAVKEKTIFSFGSLNDWFDPTNKDLMEKNLDSLPKGFSYVLSKENLKVSDKQEGKVLAHIEGLFDMRDDEEDWQTLNRWHKKGLRSIAPVWNNTNTLCGGTKDESDSSGLTDLGEKLILWCVEKGIVVDLAHANRKSFDDMVKLLKRVGKPVFVSHGNAYAVCANYRNYEDRQLMQIAESGGVLGVFFANSFINEREESDLNDLFVHIEHIRKTIGIEHLAIGSDFGGILHGSPDGLQKVEDVEKLESFLKERSYTESDIEKIFYKNAIRVLSEFLH